MSFGLLKRAIFGICILPVSAWAADIRYDAPVARYGHNVLGDTPEWGALCVDEDCVALPETRIFEDIAPHLADLDDDGQNEIITVESDLALGARLAIYDLSLQRIAATPYIGTKHRWLAPIGAADFDGDGHMEIAYVETPHLGKTLKIWEYSDGELSLEYQIQGLTNHQIGDDFILSAIQACAGKKPEIVLLSADRSRVMGVSFEEENAPPQIRDYGAYDAQNSRSVLSMPCGP